MQLFPTNQKEALEFVVMLFIQMGVFIFTFVALNFLVFRPYLKIRERRKALTSEAQEQAQQLNQKTDAMVQNYESKLQEARQQGLGFKEKTRLSGETEAREILSHARLQAESATEKTRQEIAKQVQEAENKLQQYSKELSQDMAEKLLGRKVSA